MSTQNVVVVQVPGNQPKSQPKGEDGYTTFQWVTMALICIICFGVQCLGCILPVTLLEKSVSHPRQKLKYLCVVVLLSMPPSH